jgi:hypothetical protein
LYSPRLMKPAKIQWKERILRGRGKTKARTHADRQTQREETYIWQPINHKQSQNSRKIRISAHDFFCKVTFCWLRRMLHHIRNQLGSANIDLRIRPMLLQSKTERRCNPSLFRTRWSLR